jgi:hypothetical protein
MSDHAEWLEDVQALALPEWLADMTVDDIESILEWAGNRSREVTRAKAARNLAEARALEAEKRVMELAESRSEMMAQRNAAYDRALEAERRELEWLESFWMQFAYEVPGRPGVRHDGGLSLLTDTQEALTVAGRLIPAGVEGMDWWVLTLSSPATGSDKP